MIVAAEHSLVLFTARQSSRAALESVVQWFEDGWLTSIQQRIDQGESNSDAIAVLQAALPSLVAFQQFRVRSSLLHGGDFEVLKLLRRSEEALAAIPSQKLEAEIRRVLIREARQA